MKTDWDKLARAIRRSDNLRLPQDPHKAGRDMKRRVEELARRVRKDGAA